MTWWQWLIIILITVGPLAWIIVFIVKWITEFVDDFKKGDSK